MDLWTLWTHLCVGGWLSVKFIIPLKLLPYMGYNKPYLVQWAWSEESWLFKSWKKSTEGWCFSAPGCPSGCNHEDVLLCLAMSCLLWKCLEQFGQPKFAWSSIQFAASDCHVASGSNNGFLAELLVHNGYIQMATEVQPILPEKGPCQLHCGVLCYCG